MINYNFLNVLGTAITGDNSKSWLIAICMVFSIVVIIALFVLGMKNNKDDKENKGKDNE